MSDVKVSLTQRQYCDLIAVSQAVTRVFTVPVEANPESEQEALAPLKTAGNITPEKRQEVDETNVAADLRPELSLVTKTDHGVVIQHPSVDVLFTVNSVKLQLFDKRAIREDQLKTCGIARFSLDDVILRYKLLSDGAAEAEMVLKSFNVTNTRAGNNKFREIIPSRHNRDQAQFMVLYTTSGKGSEQSALVLVTIDSPKMIFTVEPIFALVDFVTSAFPSSLNENGPSPSPEVSPDPSSSASPQLAFRVDLHDASISILENDSDPETQAIQVTIKQILMSQQVFLHLFSCRVMLISLHQRVSSP